MNQPFRPGPRTQPGREKLRRLACQFRSLGFEYGMFQSSAGALTIPWFRHYSDLRHSTFRCFLACKVNQSFSLEQADTAPGQKKSRHFARRSENFKVIYGKPQSSARVPKMLGFWHFFQNYNVSLLHRCSDLACKINQPFGQGLTHSTW